MGKFSGEKFAGKSSIIISTGIPKVEFGFEVNTGLTARVLIWNARRK